MYEDDDYRKRKRLAGDEALLLFQDQSMTTKNDILCKVDWVTNDWRQKSQTDTKHTAAFYGVILDLLDRFSDAIQKAKIFDAPDWWVYAFNIDSKGITLCLEHYNGYTAYDGENVTPGLMDETFELLKVKSKRLTVEEYAKSYEVEQGTVRQWIRRGKIRTAMKVGNEWRIPELTEPPRRGYFFGQYKWTEHLSDLPEEYAFLDDYSFATFTQENTDHTAFSVFFSSDAGEGKLLKCGAKEKEKLELFMISHPLIEFITDQIGYYSTEAGNYCEQMEV